MTIDQLVLVIATVCNIHGTQTQDKKIECFEFFTNCMVKTNGKIDQKDFAKCNERWMKHE
jgi:hypothetical protein